MDGKTFSAAKVSRSLSGVVGCPSVRNRTFREGQREPDDQLPLRRRCGHASPRHGPRRFALPSPWPGPCRPGRLDGSYGVFRKGLKRDRSAPAEYARSVDPQPDSRLTRPRPDAHFNPASRTCELDRAGQQAIDRMEDLYRIDRQGRQSAPYRRTPLPAGPSSGPPPPDSSTPPVSSAAGSPSTLMSSRSSPDSILASSITSSISRSIERLDESIDWSIARCCSSSTAPASSSRY